MLSKSYEPLDRRAKRYSSYVESETISLLVLIFAAEVLSLIQAIEIRNLEVWEWQTKDNLYPHIWHRAQGAEEKYTREAHSLM